MTFANKEFQGKGLTLQLAKHNAAEKALEYFIDPEHFLEAKSLSDSAKNESIKAYRPPQFYQQLGNLYFVIATAVKFELLYTKTFLNVATDEKTKISDDQIGKDNEKDTNENERETKKDNLAEESKSEVQLIHEYAFFLKKSVEFKVSQKLQY